MTVRGVVVVEIGDYRLAVASSFGPRVLGFRRAGGPELLARLPDDVVVEHPEAGSYVFRGGHRLWVAPEHPAVTYAPDDEPCSIVERDGGGVVVAAEPDVAGFEKQITVSGEGDRVIVDHTLTNAGSRPRLVAAWAITQFPLGGSALLPLGSGAIRDSLQADRRLVVWPYTSLTDDRIAWRPAGVVITVTGGPNLKLGAGPAPRRLGYLRDGWLFVKEIPDAGDDDSADLGAVGQVFAGPWFAELESMGPLVEMDPGDSVTHRESWYARPCSDLDRAWEVVR